MGKTTLVIMAAGIGSRYGGGIKQMESFGPSGEIMMDYSVFDALEAGFEKVVFIIRKDMDEDFRRIIGDRIAKVTEVAYAYQEKDDLPEGFSVPEGRVKPWGTGQALLAAKDVVDGPFVVINADDYYGKNGFRMLRELQLREAEESGEGPERISMAGFVLGNTLSENGGVTRGVCAVDEKGELTGITETKNIISTDGGRGAAVMSDDGLLPLDRESLVSMNMWGLHPSFFPILEEGFPKFLAELGTEEKTKEYLLPTIIDGLLQEGKAEVSVLRTEDVWFGVTYQEDKEAVKEAIRRLIAKGVYKTPLF